MSGKYIFSDEKAHGIFRKIPHTAGKEILSFYSWNVEFKSNGILSEADKRVFIFEEIQIYNVKSKTLADSPDSRKYSFGNSLFSGCHNSRKGEAGNGRVENR